MKILIIRFKQIGDAVLSSVICNTLKKSFPEAEIDYVVLGPSVCISLFSRILVISSFFKSSSGCFSFFMIFSFLAIFLVLQWTFLNVPPFSVFLAIFHVLKCVFIIFSDFQFSSHIPGPTVAFLIFHVFQ